MNIHTYIYTYMHACIALADTAVCCIDFWWRKEPTQTLSLHMYTYVCKWVRMHA
jgi:hypothetical protein